MSNIPLFGTSGFPPSFLDKFKNKRETIFTWLKSLDLDWIELQNTYGVKMPQEQAILYSELAKQCNIGISIHAPYYITLASADNDVVERSIERIRQCVALCEKLKCSRIIFHPGYFPGSSEEDRKAAVKRIILALKNLRNDIPSNINLYPETAGKKSQIGSIEEIIQICNEIAYAIPCIDWAHLHAFQGGSLINKSKINDVIDYLLTNCGKEKIEKLHSHMYPVEIDAHGEKRHVTFDDRPPNIQLSLFGTILSDSYFPRAEDYIDALIEKGISPVTICEAHNTQDTGALLMKNLYFQRMHRDE